MTICPLEQPVNDAAYLAAPFLESRVYDHGLITTTFDCAAAPLRSISLVYPAGGMGPAH